MSTLLLRLSAPMQAWGFDSKFDTRGTQREPTKSAVLGLLAASLGLKRDDTESLAKLSSLKFGVRVDREGELLNDFHMVKGAKSSYVTHRYYLCDAVFLCGLEASNHAELEQYVYALTHPAYPLFLGRRSCPPTLPLVLGIRSCDLETALREEPKLVESDGVVRIVLDAPPESQNPVCKDVPLSFNPRRREFGYRKYKEMFFSREDQQEHDPFAEVEAEYVSK